MKVHKSLDNGFNPEERYVMHTCKRKELYYILCLCQSGFHTGFSLGYVIALMPISRGLGACSHSKQCPS